MSTNSQFHKGYIRIIICIINSHIIVTRLIFSIHRIIRYEFVFNINSSRQVYYVFINYYVFYNYLTHHPQVNQYYDFKSTF